tara:strand:- start:89890 stop:90225 length:336 start_codon:yes stop_codon:yes gene_type:complete
VRQLFTHHKDAVKHMLALNEMLNQIKIFFNSFFSMLPIKTTQEFTFKGSIKWKIYLLSAFIGFIITLSSISYHNYKDNTDYEKAWKLLLKNNTTEKNKKYFNSILKTAENE